MLPGHRRAGGKAPESALVSSLDLSLASELTARPDSRPQDSHRRLHCLVSLAAHCRSCIFLGEASLLFLGGNFLAGPCVFFPLSLECSSHILDPSPLSDNGIFK